MGNTKKQRRKGGAKKYGRSLAKCKAYRLAGTREKNKARKARKEAKKAEKRAAKKARRSE